MKWTKKKNGTAIVYTHPDAKKAIVVSPYGISYGNKWYETLAEAQKEALENG